MTTIKPNDTGINLADANLPAAGDAFDDGGETPRAAIEQQPAPDPEPQEPSQEQLKQQIIAHEDRVKRREMIMVINRYYKSPRFRQYMIECDLVEQLDNMTLQEMTDLLSDIRFSIQNRSTGDMIQRGVPQMIIAAEPLISSFYDVKGLGNTLIASESFKDLLEEVALESQTFSNTPAHTRLFYEVAKTAFFVHEHNSYMAAKLVQQKSVPVSPSTADLMN
jgi:hypothetical protein